MDKATIEDKRKFVHSAHVKFYSKLILLEKRLGYNQILFIDETK